MKTTIAVLCGLPGSGKTQFVQNFSLSQCSFNILHVQYDKIIPKDSNLDEEAWKTRRKVILHSIEAYLRGGGTEKKPHWLMEEGFKKELPRVLFIDDNNYLSSMRYEYYQLCRSLEIGFCTIEMKVSLELSLSRNQELRSVADSISSETIIRMHSKFESPDPLRNHWESAYSFQVDSSQDVESSFSLIRCILESSLENPVRDVIAESKQKAEDSRSACNASVVHQADNLLRKKISASIKAIKEESLASSKETPESKIQSLLERKKVILEDLKTGHSRVPSEIVRLIGSKEERPRVLELLSKELDLLLEEKLSN